MHNSVMFAIYNVPAELQVFPTSMPSHTCRHNVYDMYAKKSVYEIKIGTLNAPLIFHHQIMFI